MHPTYDTRRAWWGLAVLALPLLVLSLDVSVLYLAAPQLSADLDASATQQLWILDIYGFLIAGFLVTMGSLGDRIGSRRLLLVGAAVFAVASVVAAFAPTAETLIGARALLGIAGATLMPSTLALISVLFPDPRRRAAAVGIWMSTFSAGVALGPLVGGLLLERFWWGSVFLLGVPVMAALLVLGPRLLPDHRPPRGEAGPLDLTSVVLSLAAMLPVVYGVKETSADGLGVRPAVAAVVGLVLGAAFVRRQRRLPHPLVDVALFGRRTFVAAVGLLLLGLVAANGLFYLLPQYLQLVEGLSPLRAGLWLLPLAGAAVLGSVLTPRLAERLGRGRLVALAALGGAVACVALTTVDADTPRAVVAGLATVAALGVTPTTVLSTDLVIGSVPPARAGSAAALSETAGELGVALGVAVTGSIVTAVYRGSLTLPEGLSPESAERARAGLAGALEVGAESPAAVGDALVASAQQAFAAGFATVGGAAAALLVTVAVLAVTLVREPAALPEDEEVEVGA